MTAFRFPSVPAGVLRSALSRLGGRVVTNRSPDSCTVVFARDGLDRLPAVIVPRLAVIDHDTVVTNVLAVGQRDAYFTEVEFLIALGESRGEPPSC